MIFACCVSHDSNPLHMPFVKSPAVYPTCRMYCASMSRRKYKKKSLRCPPTTTQSGTIRRVLSRMAQFHSLGVLSTMTLVWRLVWPFLCSTSFHSNILATIVSIPISVSGSYGFDDSPISVFLYMYRLSCLLSSLFLPPHGGSRYSTSCVYLGSFASSWISLMSLE